MVSATWVKMERVASGENMLQETYLQAFNPNKLSKKYKKIGFKRLEMYILSPMMILTGLTTRFVIKILNREP